MKRTRSPILLGALVLCPKSAWAHALSPAYYPLGHIPALLCVEWWPFIVLIPLSLAAEVLVLRRWNPSLRAAGTLWRATLLYAVSRATETVMIFASQSIPLFRRAGWSSSVAENTLPLLLYLFGGLVAAVLLGRPLYRNAEMGRAKIVMAVSSASVAAYLAALAASMVLVVIRGY